MDKQLLKTLFLERNPGFWSAMERMTVESAGYDELFFVATMRKRALAAGCVGRALALEFAALGYEVAGLYSRDDAAAEADGSSAWPRRRKLPERGKLTRSRGWL